MNLENFTRSQYQKFSMAEGSEYIASEYALFRILKLIRRYNPKAILEIGAGIGTLSDSILKKFEASEIELYAIENNKFCINSLPQNLGDDFERLRLYANLENLPDAVQFDFLIIDGSLDKFNLLKSKLSDTAIIIVEGDRTPQIEVLRKFFPNSKYVHSVSMKKNSEYSNRPATELRGGVKIFFLNPDLTRYLNWIQLKIDSKIKFELRYRI